jgi:predicted component of type VI protein secretion system
MQDSEQFAGYESDLREQLSAYLFEHARREKLALVSRPEIAFKVDDRLRLGEFGIQARLVRPDADHEGQAVRAEEGHTQVYSSSGRISEQLAEPNLRRTRAQLRYEGRAVILGSEGAVLGRSRECDVVIDDENVSRRHAEVRPSGGSWIVRDLGSTNGVKVNGKRIDQAQSLRPGDRIELGLSRVTFEEA